MNRLSKRILLFLSVLVFFAPIVFAEDITITTYYPSPYGSYKNIEIYNEDETTTQADFTQGLTSAGVLINTDYTNNAYTPGIFWRTHDNNNTKPKAGIYLMETNTGTRMYFGTSNSYVTGITNNALVIDESGNVGIGSATPGAKLDVNGNIYDGGGSLIFSTTAGTHTGIGNTAGWAAIENAANYNTLMILGRSGGLGGGRSVSVWDRLEVNGTFVNSSDVRLKKDLVKVDSAINKLEKINGYYFTWKKTGIRDMGVIAQEVEKIFPELVSETGLDVDTGEKYKSVQSLGLIAPLIESVKELQSENNNLCKEIDAMKMSNDTLRADFETYKAHQR